MKAPDALEEEIRTGLDLISTTPGIGEVARNVALPGVRRISLSVSSTISTIGQTRSREQLKLLPCGIRAEAAELISSRA
jgi:hypothetical protein